MKFLCTTCIVIIVITMYLCMCDYPPVLGSGRRSELLRQQWKALPSTDGGVIVGEIWGEMWKN